MLVACGSAAPARPANVSPRAVFLPIYRSGMWIHCWLDATIHMNRCLFYNGVGQPLPSGGAMKGIDDNVFLPYDGQGPVSEAELRHLSLQVTQLNVVMTTSGRVLIPRVDYGWFKEYVQTYYSDRIK